LKFYRMFLILIMSSSSLFNRVGDDID